MSTPAAEVEAWAAALNPDTLDAVPQGDRGPLTNQRRAEQHRCVRCGSCAHSAYVMESLLGRPIDPRWIDLCRRCDSWLRTGADAASREVEW